MTAQANLRAEYARWTTHPARCAICWIPLRRLEGLRFNSQLEMAHIISRARAGDAGNVVGVRKPNSRDRRCLRSSLREVKVTADDRRQCLVRQQVKQRIEIFGRGGGFVFNTVHNVQANTPVENLVALYETVREARG